MAEGELIGVARIEDIGSGSPFARRVGEIVDREFPLVKMEVGGGAVERRSYSPYLELVEMKVSLSLLQAKDEGGVLGEKVSGKYFSIPEAAVGFTLLAGREYKSGGRPSQVLAGWGYLPGEASFEIGNSVVALFRSISGEDVRIDADGACRRICALVVGKGGIDATMKMEEVFASIGLEKWYDARRVREATREFLEREVSEGRVVEGGVEWFEEFWKFVDDVRRTPAQRVLSEYGHYITDTLSPEGLGKMKEAIRKVYEAQSQARRVDPKIDKLARAYGLVGGDKA